MVPNSTGVPPAYDAFLTLWAIALRLYDPDLACSKCSRWRQWVCLGRHEYNHGLYNARGRAHSEPLRIDALLCFITSSLHSNLSARQILNREPSVSASIHEDNDGSVISDAIAHSCPHWSCSKDINCWIAKATSSFYNPNNQSNWKIVPREYRDRPPTP